LNYEAVCARTLGSGEVNGQREIDGECLVFDSYEKGCVTGIRLQVKRWGIYYRGGYVCV